MGCRPFSELLERVAAFYRDSRDNVRSQNAALRGVFADLVPPGAEPGAALDRAPLAACRRELEAGFDEDYGGFGGAPKFPHPGQHRTPAAGLAGDVIEPRAGPEGALHGDADAEAHGRRRALRPARRRLLPLFGRSVLDDPALREDAVRQRPAARALRRRRRSRPATISSAGSPTRRPPGPLREMQSPEGGFYSTLDADSEGHEGKFYVWDRAEVEAILAARRIPRARAPLRTRSRAQFRGRLAFALFRRDRADRRRTAARPRPQPWRCSTPAVRGSSPCASGACAPAVTTRCSRAGTD